LEKGIGGSMRLEMEVRGVLFPKVNPSTPRPECLGLLRVNPERRFLSRLKRRGLAPPNGLTIEELLQPILSTKELFQLKMILLHDLNEFKSVLISFPIFFPVEVLPDNLSHHF